MDNPGYETTDGFLTRRSVRDSWIALFLLWIIWAILFITKQAVGKLSFSRHPPSQPSDPLSNRDPGSLSEEGRKNYGGSYTASGGPVGTSGSNVPVTSSTTQVGLGATQAVSAAQQEHDIQQENQREHERRQQAHPRNTGITGSGDGHRGLLSRGSTNMRERISRTHGLARDLTMMLLLALTLNSFGRGSGVVVLILSWIYVGTALMWLSCALLFRNGVVDAFFGTIQMLLILVILILAFSLGW